MPAAPGLKIYGCRLANQQHINVSTKTPNSLRFLSHLRSRITEPNVGLVECCDEPLAISRLWRWLESCCLGLEGEKVCKKVNMNARHIISTIKSFKLQVIQITNGNLDIFVKSYFLLPQLYFLRLILEAWKYWHDSEIFKSCSLRCL